MRSPGSLKTAHPILLVNAARIGEFRWSPASNAAGGALSPHPGPLALFHDLREAGRQHHERPRRGRACLDGKSFMPIVSCPAGMLPTCAHRTGPWREPPCRYCMNQPWLTTRDWPVSAFDENAAKNSATRQRPER
jgi:hypothetical protein